MSSPIIPESAVDAPFQPEAINSTTATTANIYWPLLLLALLAVPLFAWGSASLPLTGPDEPRYAAIARAMYETGDYVTPRLAGQPWFEKPALTYWLIAAGYYAFGVGEFGARVPSVLLALLSVWAVFYTGRRIVSARFGLLAALTLQTSAAFVVYSRAAATDMPLAATLTFALCAFLLSESDVGPPVNVRSWQVNRVALWRALFYACLGLTILAKGLTGVVLAGGIIGSYLLITGRLRQFLGSRWVLGAALSLLVASLWYGPVIARYGYAFIDEFFIQHHFARYTSNKYHHPGPIYYYLIAILAGTFPWGFLLPVSLARLRPGWWRTRRREPGERWRVFALCWLAFPVIFFSFSGSKLPGYILPAIPGAALLLAGELKGLWAGRATRGRRAAMALNGVFLIAVGLALSVIPRLNIEVPLRLAIAAVVFAAGLATCFGALRRSGLTVWALVVGFTVLIPLIAIAVRPELTERESAKPLAQLARDGRRPGEPIVFVGTLRRTVHGFTFYTDPGLGYDEGRNGLTVEELMAQAATAPSLLCVVPARQLAALQQNEALLVEPLGQQPGIVLARIKANVRP